MATKYNLLDALKAALLILGALFGKSLSTAWIFQHSVINKLDTDNSEQLVKLFDTIGNKALKAVYQLESADKLFTVKQWTMIAMIARGAKSSDFTDDKATTALIEALVKTVNATYHFEKMDVPTKASKATGNTKSAKREITIK
jgi:hypothetical protein